MTDAAAPGRADLIVVGGGPAAHSAAVAYREAGGEGRVLMISADDAAPYNRPPLSKDYLRGESEEDALPLEAAEFYPAKDIELWLDDPVVALDVDARSVRTGSGRTVRFTRCVLATGCEPARLSIPGADHPRVLLLRSLAQGRALRTAAGVERAVVIGSGFIGCEAAASLAIRGVQVTVLSPAELPQVRRLGHGAGERIAGWLTDVGVDVRSGEEAVEIRDGSAVRTASGGRYDADLILSAVGVRPRAELAATAGLAVQQGRIVVDERMATGAADIYAAGDVALAMNAAAGRRLAVEHWGEAFRMGEVAGRNAAGVADSWSDVPGFWSEIGHHTVKYAAWGDGFDQAEFVDHGDGAFTVWYATAGRVVGVLTHQADDDYERAFDLIPEITRLSEVH